MKNIVALLAGVLFGVGLAASGMTNTAKVLAFLDIFGAWEIDLMLVMVGALAVALVVFPWVLKRRGPVLDTAFHLPTKTHIDRQLLLGAAIFGVGWGWYGYCPGPVIASLAYGQTDSLFFIAAMVVGMWLGQRAPALISSKPQPATQG